jgi:hypothetical protein
LLGEWRGLRSGSRVTGLKKSFIDGQQSPPIPAMQFAAQLGGFPASMRMRSSPDPLKADPRLEVMIQLKDPMGTACALPPPRDPSQSSHSGDMPA